MQAIPPFIVFCFFAFLRYCIIFYKLKVCGNPASSESISTVFPTVFAHFVSLYRISVTLTTFHIFSLLLYLLR